MTIKHFYILLFVLAEFTFSGYSQEINRFQVDTLIQYSSAVKNYDFNFQNESQGLFWGDLPIDGNYKSVRLRVYNKSKDTIVVGGVRSKDGTLVWLGSRDVEVAPNGFYELNQAWLPRLGNFSSQIFIQYTKGEESKSLRIETWGTIQPFEYIKGEKINHWKGSVSNGKCGKWFYSGDDTHVDRTVYYINNVPVIIYEDLYGFTKTSETYPEKFDTIPFVTQFYNKNSSIKKEIYLTGKTVEYYRTGGVKSIQDKNMKNDSVARYTLFYENGLIKLQQFQDSTVGFYESGRINSYGKNGITKFFYESGELKSFNQQVDQNNDSIPRIIELYKNGCVKKETYYKDHIRHFSKEKCDCRTLETYGRYDTTFIIYSQCERYTKRYFVRNQKSEHWGHCVEQGEFSNLGLVNGTLEYFQAKSKLKFTLQKENTEFMETFSYEGNEFNSYDLNNEKSGIWLHFNNQDSIEKFSKYLSQNPDLNLLNCNYKRYDKGQLIETSRYYLNGFLKWKEINHLGGETVSLYYSDSTSEIATSGKRGYNDLVFESGKLTKVISPKSKWEYREWENHSAGYIEISIPYFIERGIFKQYTLFNGYIEYFDANGNKIKTVQVVKGVEQKY